MAASAYKCKHTLNAETDPWYNYENRRSQEPGPMNQQPMARSYDQMKEQMDDNIQVNSRNIQQKPMQAQLRIQEPTRRSDDMSKVLSWKSHTENKREKVNDNSKIVFPGPTNEPLPLEIPEHCKKLGICDDVANYPQDQVNRVIDELGDLSMFQNDKLDLPEIPDITQRLGPQEDNLELCNFESKVVYPKAAIDFEGNWNLVLNKDDSPLQGFKVEICDIKSPSCAGFAIIQPAYEARCIQKYVYRKMAVLHNGTKLERSLKVPSCCSCVAKLVIN